MGSWWCDRGARCPKARSPADSRGFVGGRVRCQLIVISRTHAPRGPYTRTVRIQVFLLERMVSFCRGGMAVLGVRSKGILETIMSTSGGLGKAVRRILGSSASL